MNMQEELWGREIDGLPCVSPDTLKALEDPFIITYIMKDQAVREQMKEMGITKIVNIKELYILS